ncbi:MAG TPA: S8 family serine peptidase, partial [Actinomycetota bacterium]|nr:S8 family serine peptidase [Actinomycetota bacterium]
STAKDPTPGVVTAGNYEDRNTGERNAAMYSQSSRGRSGQPSTYPDVAAPGAAIMSTCRPNLPVCASGATTAHTKDYASLFGTSMAAPHVAGIAAMLYQADPGLTPAQVEDLLLDTAHKFTAGAAYEADPQNPGGTTSFDKGAGLADAVAALRALGLTGSGTSASTVQVVDGDGGDFPGPGALDIVGLNVSNEESGLRYILEVRDIDDAPLPSMSLRVTQNVDGKNFLTNLTVTAAGITAGTGAQATQIVRDTAANTVSFLVPWANLGNPSTNSPAHNVFVSSFVGGVVDVAPGGPGAEVLVAPRHGAPYTVRPTEETAPTPPPTPTPTPTTSTSPSPSPTPSPTGSPTPIPTGDVIFEDEATIELFSPVGVTQAEFLLTCAEPANTQGLDGYVFELPEATSAREVATLTGSENVHDLDMYFYDADCASSGDAAATTAADEIAFVPNGTKWIFAHSFDGVGTTATLKVYQGEAVPEPTPTPTVTPGDFPFGDRGVYPAEPNDPLFPADPDLPEIIGGQWGMRKIKAPEAWQEVQATGHEVKVAVLDTGLDLNHPDFDCPGKVEVIANSDFIGDGNGPEDGAGHGTHVAGIVGACTNNGEGVVGVAPDATIMPIQVLDADGSGDPLTTLPGGIRAATDAGANVINMSLGTLPVFTPIDVLIEDVFPEVDEAVEYATTHGVVVIAAAGNESFPLCSYPAIIEDIVCVGSTDSRDVNSYFGNFPVNDDDQDTIGAGLMAPGGSGQVFCDVSAENIVSTYAVELDPCDEGFAGYTGLDGTSMAAPHVAGVAALVYDRLGERTEANGQAVIDALISSTDDLYAPGWDPASGYGRVNALNAVHAVDAVEPPLAAGTTTQITDDSATSGQFSDAATIAAELTDEDGNPISGSELAFELVGSGGTKSWTATTDENGVAAANVDLDLAPGTYTLAAGFSGVADEYEPSADLGSFQIVKEAATLSFGSGSATSGQYSDTAAVSALLTDDDGTPLAGVEVVYELAGQTATAITGADGVAATTLNLVDQAGAYQLKASYPENAFHQAAQTASDFTIRAEDSRTTLQVPGPGSDRVYRATVVETDGGTGLAGVVVEFLANGNRIGTATTNANGVATITAKFAKKTVYEAVFAGDAYYLRSSARYQEK